MSIVFLRAGFGLSGMMRGHPALGKALTTGTTQRIYLGNVRVPDRKQDWDLHVTGVVDPPASAQGLGSVWERNESYNAKAEHCRLHGMNPDPGVAACN